MDIIILKLTEKVKLEEEEEAEKKNSNNKNKNNKKYEFSLKNYLKFNTTTTTKRNNRQMHNKAQFKKYKRKLFNYKQQQQQQQQLSQVSPTTKTTNFINHLWDYCSITCIPPVSTSTTTTTRKRNLQKNGNLDEEEEEKCHNKNNYENSIKIVLKTTKNNNNNKKKDANYYWHSPYRLICGKSGIFSTFSTSNSFPSISFLLVLSSCCLLTTTTTITTAKTTMSTITTNLTLPTVYASYNTTTTTTINFSNDQHQLLKREAANSPTDLDDSNYDEEFDEYDALIRNKSAKGKYIGAPCNEMKCEPSLLHVTCDKTTLTCGCEKNYPVQIGLIKGCDKPKKLGEQCFYDETCMYSDENSLCVQVRHNALCQCAHGFHSVSYMKPTKRVFCTQDLQEINRTDFPTLLGVASGIAVLAGLICMVLHLFSKTKYPRNRNFADHHGAPPIMYSSDTGIPLTVQSGRPSSRSSIRSSGSIGSYGNRRASSTVGAGSDVTHVGSGGPHGSKGIMVSTSRTGSRRPSLASVHSTSSSVRSYSMMRFEKEAQQKEIRNEMKLRLARLQQQQHLQQNKPHIIIGDVITTTTTTTTTSATTTATITTTTTLSETTTITSSPILQQHHGGPNTSPNAAATLLRLSNIMHQHHNNQSPLTPNSLDELLPAVDETQEYIAKNNEQAKTTMAATTTTTTTTGTTKTTNNVAFIGPCSESTETL